MKERKPKKQKKPELKIPPPPRGLSRVKKKTGRSGERKSKCPCGKIVFTTYDKAMGAAHRVIPTDVKRVYYCAEGGGFHFTGNPNMSRVERYQEFDAFRKLMNEENGRCGSSSSDSSAASSVES